MHWQIRNHTQRGWDWEISWHDPGLSHLGGARYPPHKQGCSLSTRGSEVFCPKHWCQCMTWCWCSYIWHGRSVQIWSPSHTGRRVLDVLRTPIYSGLGSFMLWHTRHCPSLPNSGCSLQRQKAQTSQVYWFSSLCLLHMLLNSSVSSSTSLSWWPLRILKSPKLIFSFIFQQG